MNVFITKEIFERINSLKSGQAYGVKVNGECFRIWRAYEGTYLRILKYGSGRRPVLDLPDRKLFFDDIVEAIDLLKIAEIHDK